jgi:hypothetical protein
VMHAPDVMTPKVWRLQRPNVGVVTLVHRIGM